MRIDTPQRVALLPPRRHPALRAAPAARPRSVTSSQERPASIEADGLVREFKKGPRAVDGIDLQVAPGEIYGFLGPNGAGKSTTVLMLTTLLPPTAGTATVAGFDVVARGPAGAARRSAPLCRRRRSTRSSPAASTCGCRPRCTACRRRSGASAATSCSSGSGSRGGRPQGRRLLGRHEAPARPGAGARPPPARSSSSTSPPPASTSRAAPRSGRRSPGSPPRTASPSSSPPSTWRRPTRSPTGSGSSTTGQIVAEGTPAELKAEIGRPTVEAVPRDPAQRERDGRRARPLRRARRRLAQGRRGAAARRRGGAGRGGARARRRGDRDRAPAAARALARRRLPRQDRPLAGGRRRRGRGAAERAGGAAARERAAAHPGRAARPPLGAAHPAPAGADRARR